MDDACGLESESTSLPAAIQEAAQRSVDARRALRTALALGALAILEVVLLGMLAMRSPDMVRPEESGLVRPLVR